jgi:hypothetical protein
MAQAADYFLAAMDRYDEARTRKQQLAMQQEQHALYMQHGLMQLDEMRQKVDDGNEFQAILQDPSVVRQATTQPTATSSAPAPAQPTPSFDSSALHKTLTQASGYMKDFNEARGNSGFGTALSMHPQEDGSYILGAANPEQGGALPLTVNPRDNTSAPLRVLPENIGALQAHVQGTMDATGGDPAKMKAAAQNQFGLHYDENGIIQVPAAQPAAPDLAALPAQKGAAPNYGPRVDGTMKGNGYFGPIPTGDGRVATEIGIGLNFGGKEVEVPALVPTLTRQEVDYLVGGGKPTPEIVQKAGAFAAQRMKEGKSPFAQEGEQGALPPAPGTKTKTSVSVSVSTKTRFNKATVHDPVKFQEAAADPNLRPNERDRQVLKQIDEDHTYGAGIPLHLRGRVAALGLKAGYFTGEQALNMAQTGFSNMNSMQLEQAMNTLKMNKVQFRKAELDFTNALKYDARLKQAQLDNYGWATKASQARITVSTETANAVRSKRLGAVNDNVMKLTGEAIDRYGLQNNIDPEKMKQLKAELQPAMVAALSSKYGDQISTVVNDGKTPLALQQLADQVLAAQLDPNKKQQPSAYSTTQDLLDGKGAPTPETRATVMGSLPKNQEGNIKENAGTFKFLKEMAAGTADSMKLKDGDKGAFVDKAATDLMTIMPMLGLRGQDLQGSASSNYGFVASVIGAYGRMKQTPETRMYGDENLMMIAVTNKLSGVPADVEAQQSRDVMLRLEVLGKGNNYYHQLVTKLSEQDHVPNKDLYKTALGQLDVEVESMGKAQEVAARSAAERAQKAQTQQPWSPQQTIDASQFWK